MLGLADFFVALRDGSHAAGEAASYCLGSLLWSAFFFMLGYLSALAVTELRNRHLLGRKRRDHT